MSRDESTELLSILKRPAAPEGLRARSLEAARSARVHGVPVRRIEDRLWESRPLRLAWTGAVVVLAMINLVPAMMPAAQGPGLAHASSGARTGIADIEAVLEGFGPKGPTLRQVMSSMEELLCDGLEDCARAVAKGETQ